MTKLKSLKILHLPTNWSGTTLEISNALRNRGHRSRLLVLYSKHKTNKFSIPGDIELTTTRTIKNFLLLIRTGIWALIYFEIFHFYGRAFVTLKYPPSNNQFIKFFEQLHLPFLKMLGKKIYFTFLGTDMRIPGVTKNRIPYDETNIKTNYDIDLKLHALQIIDRYADGIFFPPPLNLEKLISHKPLYFTVFINLENFENVGISEDLSYPKIIHAPSNPSIKGTDYVEQAIEQLRSEGYTFEFKLIENMRQAEFFNEIKSADIILDQFIVGGYGKLALEAMAMGKPVFGHINTYYLPFFPKLPIIRTDKTEIADRLRFYLENPEKLKEVSKESREFVEQSHDSKKLARELEEIYMQKG